MKVVIIGGGAAGATAAQFARKQSSEAQITVFEKGPYPEYSRCGMPNVLSGQIPTFDSLIEYSQEWFLSNKIDLRLSTEVTSIDATDKKIEYVGKEGKKSEPYDALIFATGASVSIPRIDSILREGKPRVGAFIFRSMDDAKALQSWCSEGKRNVLIIGAGLIGLEVADALAGLGHKVKVVEYLDAVLPAMMDPDMTTPVSDAIKAAGIELMLSSSVEAIIGDKRIEGAKVAPRDGSASRTIICDTIVLSTGQKPTNELASDAGCTLGARGHIKVDERCSTSVEGIYAIGDCSEYRDMITGDASPSGQGTLAVKMGEVAGRNSVGGKSALPGGFLNSRVTKLFNLEIAATGPLSSVLASKGINVIQSRIKGSTLPSYFPGGEEMTIKLVSSENGKLLSCQILGKKEAALRIDIVSSLIASGKAAADLAQLENAYAPPVAPTVDALAVAAQGILIKIERSRK